MRTHAKWLSALLAVVMLVGVCIPASAAGVSLFTLTAQPATVGTGREVTVSVNAAVADVVADGKLTVTYDAALVQYEGASAGEAWPATADLSLQDNDKGGKIVLAFAGVDAAGTGAIIDLHFTALSEEGTAVFTVDADNSYVTGGEEYSLEASLNLTVAQTAEYTVTFVDGYTGETLGTQTVLTGDAATPPTVVNHGGYYFIGWDKDFSCITEDVTVTANFCTGEEDCPSHRFTDVNYTQYYHAGVDYVVAQGYMNGMGGTIFGTGETMTRGMMVTVLYRMAGCPDASGYEETPFVDAADGAYYSDAVRWAYGEGLVRGVTQTLLAPEDSLTREQMVTFLYRFAKFEGLDVTVEGDLSDFTDAGEVSAYAVESMTWAVSKGIVLGTTYTTLSPKDASLRCQVAVVIWRFDRANNA